MVSNLNEYDEELYSLFPDAVIIRDRNCFKYNISEETVFNNRAVSLAYLIKDGLKLDPSVIYVILTNTEFNPIFAVNKGHTLEFKPTKMKPQEAVRLDIMSGTLTAKDLKELKVGSYLAFTDKGSLILERPDDVLKDSEINPYISLKKDITPTMDYYRILNKNGWVFDLSETPRDPKSLAW